MEMKIRESCLQSGTFIYKPGISVTKQDFHLQMGSLGLQMGFSGYYLPDRNDATHIYNEEAAQQLVEKILHQYIGVFVSLEQQIRARYGDEVLEQL